MIITILFIYILPFILGWTVVGPLMMGQKPPVLELLSRNKSESDEVELDDKGVSKTLDYHHIRAREIEMGIEVDELTSCGDESCRVCTSKHTARAAKELAAVEGPITFDRLSDQLDAIQRKIDEEYFVKVKAEKAKREAEIAEHKRIEYEKQFLVDYPASNYRPTYVPDHAAVEGRDVVNGVRLTWTWDDHIYHKIVPRMVIRLEVNPGYTDGSEVPEFTDNWTLRKRRPVDKKDDTDFMDSRKSGHYKYENYDKCDKW